MSLELELEYAPGKSDMLLVDPSDDVSELARAFVRKHGLPDGWVPRVEKAILQNAAMARQGVGLDGTDNGSEDAAAGGQES